MNMSYADSMLEDFDQDFVELLTKLENIAINNMSDKKWESIIDYIADLHTDEEYQDERKYQYEMGFSNGKDYVKQQLKNLAVTEFQNGNDKQAQFLRELCKSIK